MYKAKFNAAPFLDQYHTFLKMGGRIKHQMNFYHVGFQNIPCSVQVLEFSAGPSLSSVISAATKASQIILTDYTESNRKALCQWLNRDNDAFDWSLHFHYVVKKLEGKGDNEVEERMEQIHELVKAVPCTVMEEPALLEHNKLYDVVITFLVAEVVATNLEEVSLYLTRIGRFVKPGGTLLYYGVENRYGYYDVGGNHFPNLHVTAAFVMSALEAAGFKDLILQTYEPHDDPKRVFRSIIGTAKQDCRGQCNNHLESLSNC